MRDSRKVFSAVITTTATAYTAADQVGGLITFSDAAEAAKGAALLESVTLIDNEKVKANLILFLFSKAPPPLPGPRTMLCKTR